MRPCGETQEEPAVEAGRERAPEQADVVVLDRMIVRERGERAVEGVEQERDLVGVHPSGLGHRRARPLEQSVERRQQVARERDRERAHADAQPDHHHREDLHVAVLAGERAGFEVDAQVVALLLAPERGEGDHAVRRFATGPDRERLERYYARERLERRRARRLAGDGEHRAVGVHQHDRDRSRRERLEPIGGRRPQRAAALAREQSRRRCARHRAPRRAPPPRTSPPRCDRSAA